MAPLNAMVALTAPPDMDVELPMGRLARDLDLELLGDVGFVERPAAPRADLGQRRLMDLVNLLAAGRLAMGLGAGVLPGLAAGLLGLVRGLALGEWGGLALAGAGRLLKLAAEALVLGLQVVDPPLEGIAVGASGRLQDGIVRTSGRCSGRERAGGPISPGLRR